jgi:hypothetical protein
MAKGNRQSRNRLVLFFPVGHLSGASRTVSAAVQFFEKVQRCFGAAFLIPSDRVLNICDRALVVINTLSAHSPWPRARDAVLPKGRSRLCPLSDLRFCVRLPRPMPLGQIPRLSSRVLAKASLSSTERASARFRRSEISGLIASFYRAKYVISSTPRAENENFARIPTEMPSPEHCFLRWA